MTPHHSSLDDRQIMTALKEGRSELLAVLFERYHVRLFNFLYRLTGDRMTSEDLVQEVFFRILRSCHTYKGRSRFTVWMYTIARNIHIDHLRRNKSDLPLEEVHQPPPCEGPLPDDHLEMEEDKSLLMKALSLLPARKRELIILSRFQYLDYRSIARLYGVKISLIKVTVYRGIQDLKKIFQQLKEGAT